MPACNVCIRGWSAVSPTQQRTTRTLLRYPSIGFFAATAAPVPPLAPPPGISTARDGTAAVTAVLLKKRSPRTATAVVAPLQHARDLLLTCCWPAALLLPTRASVASSALCTDGVVIIPGSNLQPLPRERVCGERGVQE